jgi:hypothetical protein
MEEYTMCTLSSGSFSLIYEIWDFYDSENVYCGLLGYDAVKMKAVRSSKILVTIYKTTKKFHNLVL